MYMKICVVGDFLDIITCAKFQNEIFRSYDFTGGEFSIFPIDFEWASDWKLAEVIAIHKKGAKSERENYRPVSLTSICRKILESFIRDHTMSYLWNSYLLHQNSTVLLKIDLQCCSYYICWTNGLYRVGQKSDTSRTM